MSDTNISTSLNSSLANIVTAIVVPLVSLVFVLAVLIFIWGVAGILIYKDNAEKREEGQRHMLWGVVGMFIMIGTYGIIRLIANTLGVASPL
jgi:hypothetical protein